MASEGLRGVLNGSSQVPRGKQRLHLQVQHARHLLKVLLFERPDRLIEVSALKVCPANYFALLGLSGKAIHTPKKYRN